MMSERAASRGTQPGSADAETLRQRDHPAASGALLATIYCYKNNVSSGRRRTMLVTSSARVLH